MSFSTDLSNKILDQILGNTGMFDPTNVFVALFTGDPGDNFAGYGNELSGNAYTRITVLASFACWATAASESAPNLGAITFPTATGAWGTITHGGLMSTFSGTTSADLLGYNALTSNVTIASGDIFNFAVGAFKLTHE